WARARERAPCAAWLSEAERDQAVDEALVPGLLLVAGPGRGRGGPAVLRRFGPLRGGAAAGGVPRGAAGGGGVAEAALQVPLLLFEPGDALPALQPCVPQFLPPDPRAPQPLPQ